MVLEQVAPDLLLADFGVSVTAGAISGIGVLDQNSQIALQGQIIMVNYALTCRTDLFGNLQHGAAITVAGEPYEVDHEPIRIADGVYSVIPLERVQGYEGVLTDIIFDGGDADSVGDIPYSDADVDIIFDGGTATDISES
jgi:hypothetical protein